MLWLDCNPEHEDKVWSLVQSYTSAMSSTAGTKRVPKSLQDGQEIEEEDSPLDIRAKDRMKEVLADFLTSEDID